MTEVGEGHGQEHFCALPPVDAQRAAALEQAANATQYLGTQQETVPVPLDVTVQPSHKSKMTLGPLECLL